MSKNRIATAIALVLGLAGSASAAGVLSTPTLFQGSGQNVCVATNVGKVPVEVTVKMVSLTDTTEETCTIDPGDPGGCQNSVNGLAYCQVIVQGSAKRVRAVMFNRNLTSPFTINAAVEAR
ncbi:MAG: hypothetical protein AB1689_08430 [Thermodesulfobacteriota bacterium]